MSISVTGNKVANTTGGKRGKTYDDTKEFMYTQIIKENKDGTTELRYINHEKLWEYAYLLEETDPDRLDRLRQLATRQHKNRVYNDPRCLNVDEDVEISINRILLTRIEILEETIRFHETFSRDKLSK